jgi:hypothetical protein
MRRSLKVRRMDRRTSLLPHAGHTNPAGRISFSPFLSPLDAEAAAKSDWLIEYIVIGFIRRCT